MKTFASVLAATAMLASAAGASAATSAEKGEAELARLIDGRTAGEPVNCISALNSSRIRIIEHVGVVYDAGKTIYVARSDDPKALGPWDVPVFQRFGSQLCTNDVIRTVDRSTGMQTGVVFLDDFVPYTKAG